MANADGFGREPQPNQGAGLLAKWARPRTPAGSSAHRDSVLGLSMLRKVRAQQGKSLEYLQGGAREAVSAPMVEGAADETGPIPGVASNTPRSLRKTSWLEFVRIQSSGKREAFQRSPCGSGPISHGFLTCSRLPPVLADGHAKRPSRPEVVRGRRPARPSRSLPAQAFNRIWYPYLYGSDRPDAEESIGPFCSPRRRAGTLYGTGTRTWYR